jgi:hypothetical protein
MFARNLVGSRIRRLVELRQFSDHSSAQYRAMSASLRMEESTSLPQHRDVVNGSKLNPEIRDFGKIDTRLRTLLCLSCQDTMSLLRRSAFNRWDEPARGCYVVHNGLQATKSIPG